MKRAREEDILMYFHAKLSVLVDLQDLPLSTIIVPANENDSAL